MFLWSSCMSIAKCCAFLWKSATSRFHVDLIQAAAARLVWSTAVARRRRGWVALDRCALYRLSCWVSQLQAKWLHCSSEDGLWRDIKLLQDGLWLRSNSSNHDSTATSFGASKGLSEMIGRCKSTKMQKHQRLVSSKACDWLLWSSVWRWYLQTRMIQGSKLQKPGNLRTGPRAASC